MEQQRHEMILEKTYPTGEEEWHCPACGRRMLLNWRPQFKKVVLEAGDDYAMHSATKGLLPNEPLQMAPADADTLPGESEVPIEYSGLAPWLAWLEKVDFDSLWDKKG